MCVFQYCSTMQVSKALKLSTERSLIILDEFGKGTATVSCKLVLYSHIIVYNYSPYTAKNTIFVEVTKMLLLQLFFSCILQLR